MVRVLPHTHPLTKAMMANFCGTKHDAVWQDSERLIAALFEIDPAKHTISLEQRKQACFQSMNKEAWTEYLKHNVICNVKY
jgi:hypothetical protein